MNRWDIKAVEELPDYMKICYVALLNLVDEFSYDVLKDEGLNIRHNIEEEWARLCRSYMVETRWFQRNYVPTMKEYVENAWISVGGPAMIVHAYPLLGCKISEDTLNAFTNS